MSIQLYPLFRDHAVLQADLPTHIWGTCDKDAVTLMLTEEGSGKARTFHSTVSGGRFELFLAPTPSGGPYTLEVSDGDSSVILRDILFGEVYILGGQSNMEMPLSWCFGKTTAENIYQADIDRSACNEIREMQSGPVNSEVRLESPHISRPWNAITPQTLPGVSAAGYFFARRLHEGLGVPIGIVAAARGGTPIGDWMPDSGHWFNGTVAPLLGLSARGVLWYQGEGDHDGYAERLAAMIAAWRKEFDAPELHFHVIQLPRMRYEEIWFLCREEDKKVCSLTEHCTYSVNIDTGLLMSMLAKGDEGNLDAIHPYQKKEVGERAADAMLEKFYGLPGTRTSPYLAETRAENGEILLRYENVGSGLVLRGLAGYEIQTADGTWQDAEPTLLDGQTVRLVGENIQAVRYGFSNESRFTVGEITDCAQCVCLYSKDGYPAEQFLISLA